MDNDFTQQLISQLPTKLEPDSPLIDVSKIKWALRAIERQQLTLAVGRWLDANADLMEGLRFSLKIDQEGRVYLVDDEVLSVRDQEFDEFEVRMQVDGLIDEIDDRNNPDIEDFTRALLDAMNKAQWAMPAAWVALESVAPIAKNHGSGPNWLERHKIAWQHQALAEKTPSTKPGKPKRRI